MQNFAILRIEKIKTGGVLRGKLNHNLRMENVLNADPDIRNPELPAYNHQTTADAIKDYQRKMESITVPRKDSIIGLEYLLTASNEFFKGDNPRDLNEWVDENIRFLEDRHGKENILNVVFHMDEKTPHLHAVVIPALKNKDNPALIDKKSGKLRSKYNPLDRRINGKFFTGGRDALSKLQTQYASRMEKFNLSRGKKEKRQAAKRFKK